MQLASEGENGVVSAVEDVGDGKFKRFLKLKDENYSSEELKRIAGRS